MSDTTNKPPPAPREGARVLTYLKQLEMWLSRNQAVPGRGLRSSQTPSGRAFSVRNIGVGFPPFHIEQVGSLDVEIYSGRVILADIDADAVDFATVSGSSLTVSNGTTVIYLTIPLAATTFNGDTKIFQLDGSITRNTASSLPSNTFDSDTLTDGDLYVNIGTIVASGGEITSITQARNKDFVCWPTAYTWYDTPIPDGSSTNDILYWDDSSEEWTVLSAPSTSGNYYLKVESGTLKWQEAGSC